MDPRIPMAWKHREMTFSRTSMTSSSSDEREEQHYRPLSRHSNLEDRAEHFSSMQSEMMEPPNQRERRDSWILQNLSTSPFKNPAYRLNGSVRSTRSVPAFTFTAPMDDPCPLHGLYHGTMRRHGSLFDVRSSLMCGTPMIGKNRLYGSKHSLSGQHIAVHPETPQYLPSHLLKPIHHGRMPVINPMSDQFNKGMIFHQNFTKGHLKKDTVDPYSVEQVCCKGHLIVLWIILGVVTVGVILGIIMGVTIT